MEFDIINELTARIEASSDVLKKHLETLEIQLALMEKTAHNHSEAYQVPEWEKEIDKILYEEQMAYMIRARTPEFFEPDEYGSRAFIAYCKSKKRPRGIPKGRDGYSFQGKKYIILYNVRGILAVYLIRNDGRLRRLEKYPAALDSIYI